MRIAKPPRGSPIVAVKTRWTDGEIEAARAEWLRGFKGGGTGGGGARIPLLTEIDWSGDPGSGTESSWSEVDYKEGLGFSWWLAKYDRYPT